MSDADTQETGDKPYDPTPKKLDDARRKGEIPRSQDLNTSAAYGGLLLACLVAGPGMVEKSGTVMRAMIDRPEELAAQMLGPGGAGPAGGLIATVSGHLAMLFVVPAGLVIATLAATRGFAPSGQKLEPKLSRISPIANAKNKYGRSGLFEFAKSFAKLMIYGVVLGIYLVAQAPQLLATVSLGAGQATVVMGQLSIGFLGVVLAISLVIGAADTLWQRAEHHRQHRMSHKEMTDEQKQAEGDPHMKQERRQRGYDIATNRMLADVPTASVVIVNPEHYAVALKWDPENGRAPLCVAKGVDEIALKIRELAGEAGVPIRRDPATARSLHATVEIGREIDRGHYRAVAAAIRFADRMRRHGRPAR